MPEAEQGMNVARIASLRAGLPVEVSALTINRFCSSGLQAIAMAAERIMSGGAEVIVAAARVDVDDPDGRAQNFAQSVAGRSLSGRISVHGPDRRAGRASDWHHARSRRTNSRCAATRKRWRRFKRASSTDEIVPVPVRVQHAERIETEAPGNRIQSGRRPARRYVARSPARAEGCVSCERHGHGREFVANVGWRRRSRGHVGRAGQGAGHPAAGALCRVRDRGI